MHGRTVRKETNNTAILALCLENMYQYVNTFTNDCEIATLQHLLITLHICSAPRRAQVAQLHPNWSHSSPYPKYLELYVSLKQNVSPRSRTLYTSPIVPKHLRCKIRPPRALAQTSVFSPSRHFVTSVVVMFSALFFCFLSSVVFLVTSALVFTLLNLRVFFSLSSCGCFFFFPFLPIFYLIFLYFFLSCAFFFFLSSFVAARAQ